jgi:hypothetical protein
VEGGGGDAFSPLDGAVWARVTEKGHIVELYGLKKKGAMAGEVEGRGGGGGGSAHVRWRRRRGGPVGAGTHGVTMTRGR